MSSQCDISGVVAVCVVAAGAGAMFLAYALVFDFKGFRTGREQRDERVNQWLIKRHLKYLTAHPRYSRLRWLIVGWGVALWGLIGIASGVHGLIAC